MLNLKKKIISFVVAFSVMLSGASVIAIALQDVDKNTYPVETMDNLPDRPGRF